jgi:tetratricopeptide (TPR) repeat protein
MFASQEYESAISTYKEAILLKDDYYDAPFNLARAYIQTGKNAEALDLLNRLEGEINNPDYYYERGRANYNLKNYKKAIEDFKVVISNTPLHSNALYSLGLALNETGEYDEALVYLNKALIINPNNDVLKKLIAEIEAK